MAAPIVETSVPRRASSRTDQRRSRRGQRGSTLAALFTATVEQYASRNALVQDGVALTYRQLDEESSRMARVLIEHGASPESVVALALPRSLDSVIAIWAVAKTGATFAPIDPSYPADRIAYMLADSGATLGLTESRAFDDTTTWLTMADVRERANDQPSGPLSYTDRLGALRPANTAYLIYTSGSTGQPKGVAVSHAGLAAVVAAQRAGLGLDETARVAHLTSPSFDAAIFEILLAHATGGALVVGPPELLGGDELAAFLAANRVTHSFMTPATLSTVDAAAVPSLRAVVSGGEACPQNLVPEWTAPGRTLFNGYGPTESTMMATGGALDSALPITIGDAIDGTQCYVLDGRLQEVPTGVTGELYLAGAGLARGYHDRSALTAARFVADPHVAGTRMYRTGDLVRRTASGALEYLGRNDFQVKLRGFRIELDEIDAALGTHPDVRFAVTTLQTIAGASALVSYVLVHGNPDPEQLTRHLERSLPRHMVPGSIVVLDELPLTPAGKLDRAALPVPTVTRAPFRTPTTPAEQSVCDIFAELLAVDEVGADDDFFALGGNSLLATQVVARLAARHGRRVSARTLFDAATPAALAAALAESTEDADERPVAGTRPNRIPLSLAQLRYWILNRIDPSSAVDNIPLALELRGELDPAALAAAIRDVAQRHESLRTIYPADAEGAHQHILPLDRFPVDCTPVDVAADEVISHVTTLATRGFDVIVEPAWRFTLLRVNDDHHVLVVVAHHIAADGTSMAPFAKDLLAAYGARRDGDAPDWTPLSLQYADFALWQNKILGSADDPESKLATQLAYWSDKLAGIPDQLDLPTDRPRPAAQSFRGAAVRIGLDGAVHRDLLALGQRSGATLFMVMRAALAVLLARTSGSADIVVGTPVAGRTEAELEPLIGMFVNTLALRTRVDNAGTFAALLDQVRDTDLEALAHTDVPFERVVEEIDPVRSAARNPVFQVGLSFQNMRPVTVRLDGIDIAPIDFDTSLVKTDLHVTIVDSHSATGAPDEVWIEFGYATDLFDEQTVASLAERYRRVLTAIVANPDVVVGDIALLPKAESDTVRAWSRGSEQEVPHTTLAELVAAQAVSSPDAIALIALDETLTYRELDTRANRLARHLITLGVGPEVRVAVALRRGVELLIAINAIGKAGGAYVPIDPDHPIDRIELILDGATPACVLTTTADDPGLAAAIALDHLDLEAYDDGPIAQADRLRPLRPENAAYTIFTSGSTGRPKGVTITHAAIVNQLSWKTAEFDLRADDVAILKTAATFDLSVWELWSPLVSGGTLVVSGPEDHRDPARLLDLIETHGVTTLHVVPSMLAALLTQSGGTLPNTVRRVLAIGEALPAHVATEFVAHNQGALYNLYGPTETAVSVTSNRVDSDTTIGTPCWNTEALVLDERLQLVAPGVSGELYLGGAQLALGYATAPGLTATRFVAAPNGQRRYRTGDVVSWTTTGTLRYVGRSDHQVKLRGHRIELGEVETVLARQPGVREAAAIVRDGHLVAYLVGSVADTQPLDGAVRAALPSYMVPSAYVTLPALPRNINGKLDPAALPAPTFAAADFRAPRTATERAVAATFADVLGIARVGADDEFFALGGNSLSATRVVARLSAEFGVALAVRTLFDAPSVTTLAAFVDAGTGSTVLAAPTAGVRPPVIPLSCAQQRMWFLNRFEDNAAYNIPIAVRLGGRLDVAALAAAVGDVARRHETLRTYYPESAEGPEQLVLEELPQLITRRCAAVDLPRELTEFVTAPFDVTAGVPIRVALFELAAGDHVLALAIHHIAADGASVAPLTRDLMAAYAARVQGSSVALPALAVQYADYSIWQRSTLGDLADLESPAGAQLTYWKQNLQGIPDALDLPLDRRRPAVASHAGARVRMELDPDLHARLSDLARSHSSSLFVVLHAALAVLLARTSSTSDIAIGTPVAGRGHSVLDDLIGMFVNTLVLRTQIDTDDSFAAVLAATREIDLDAYAHSDVPFETIVDALQPNRSTAHHPLFQVSLALQNMERGALELPGLAVAPVDIDTAVAQFDLSFTFADAYDEHRAPAGCAGYLTYATDLFDPETAELLVERYLAVLRAVCADDAQPVGDIALPSTGGALVGASHEIDPGTVLDAFAAQVRQTPDHVAIGDGATQLTYVEFSTRVNRLARQLISLGAGPEKRITVALPRGIDLITATYAVLTTGAAYVPIDPEHPRDRSDHIRATADPLFEIDADMLAGLTVDHLPGTAVTDAERHAPLRASNTAYVLFTSGSTGRPKGVAVDHAALRNQIDWLADRFKMTLDDVVLQKTPTTFDVSAWELFCPLTVGARMVVASPDGHRDPAYLAEVIAAECVTMVSFVPSMAAVFAEQRADLPSLRAVLLAGEALGAGTVAALRETTGAALHNLYGPTEFTVHATESVVSGPNAPIGVPVWNSRAYVLDSRLRPVPDGSAGELYLAGSQLARGYFGNADLTAARFVADPSVPGDRMYRTGDIVRLTRTGELDYLGRADDQVKVRGIRIELGEVEAALAAVPGVVHAAAAIHADTLVGYVTPADVDTASVKATVAARVPSFLVPTAIVALDELPIGSTGKLNRRALPTPTFERAAYVPPTTDAERTVATAFADVLGLDRVGIEDDFFDLGGSSLHAVRLRTALDKAGVTVDIRTIFAHPTVRSLVGADSTGHTTAELEADAILDPAIVTTGLPTGDRLETVLVTGATGFVGVHIVAEFLRTTSADVWCVVRSESGTERLHDAMRTYRVWDGAYADRIVVLRGDLARPRLGLSTADYERVTDTVDLIVHNGARVNHLEPYHRMKPANVDGTTEILRIATTTRLKAVHFVSTSSAVTSYASDAGVAHEDTHIRADELSQSGYVASKWVGEQLVRAARERGVPAVIHRPGLLCGAPDTGAMSIDDSFWNMMRAMTVLGIAPAIDDVPVLLTPVSYVAQAIVGAAVQPDPAAVYHLTTDSTVCVGAVFDALRRNGYALESAALDEFSAALDSAAAQRDSQLARAASLAANYGTTGGAAVSSDWTRSALGEVGITCPVVDDDTLDAYVRYYRDIGFL